MNISSKSILSAATCRLALLLAAVFLPCLLARANIVGAYTPDANTLYLFHFDEPAGSSVTTNVGIKGGNCITVTNTPANPGLSLPPTVTTMLGKTSYTNVTVQIGFGNCVSGTNTMDPSLNLTTNGLVGYDGNTNGVYNGDINGTASADAIAMTNLNIGNPLSAPNGNSPFTIEALVCPTAIGGPQREIVCTDTANGARGFQFRINNNAQLEFNYIGGAGSGSKTAAIPTSTGDPNHFVAGNWYHVAVTYDGTNLLLYWTWLDQSSGACNQIGGPYAWASTNSNGAVVAPLVIGNENRAGSTENFIGLIDEVRISSVCRGPGQMMFTNAGVVFVKHPASQNVDYFLPATFKVTTTSPTPMGYRWRFNGTPIAGDTATNTSYSIPSVDLRNVGGYDCVVTNSAGYANTSHVAQLVVGADHFLAHRWSFNSDALTNDLIGSAKGTLQGNAMVTNGSLVLDGTTGTYMQLPPYLIFNTNTAAANYPAVTFEFWATYNTSGNNDRIFDFGNTNFVNATVLPPENYVYFSPHAGTNHVLGFSPTTSESQISATGAGNLDGQYMHVACVVDPPDNVMSIYTNGVFETSATLSASLDSIVDQKCWIGRSLFTADSWINASIDELRIYGGALSAASIAQSYLQGPDVPLNAGAVAITVQPTNVTGAVGYPVSLIAALVGRAPISIQWYTNGTAIAGATNSIYTFTPSSTSQSGLIFQLLATNNVSGTNYNVASSNATLTVTLPETLVWAGVNGGNWDTSTLNWSNSTPALVAFAQYDGVVFDDRGGSHQSTVNVPQLIDLTYMVVSNNAYNYVLQSPGQVGSLNGQAVSFVKAGTGKFTLDVTNNCTGTTVVQNGVLQVGNADAAGTLSAGPVTNNATLVFNRNDGITVTNNISGSGTVIYSGTGNLSLSGSNSYSGLTIISSNGVLHPKNANALGVATAGLINTNGGKLYVDVNADFPNEPLTLGGGTALQKGSSGVSTLGGTVTLVSDTAFSVDGGATLNLTNASGVNGSSTVNLTLAGAGAGNIGGPLALGTGNLTVSGGTWTVAPSNSYSGLTAINGGALFITGPLSLSQPPVSFNPSQVSLNGGTLGAATSVTLNDGKIGITLTTNSSIAVNNASSTLTISNDISGDATWTLTKTGSGRLVLNGANDFAGTFNVDSGSTSANDGATVIANNAAIANILVSAGSPFIFIRNNNGGSSTLALDGTLGSITVAPDISLAGRTTNVAAIENIAGDNTISGNFTLVVGGSYILQSDSGTLTLTQPWPYAPPLNVTSARVLTLTGAGIITMAGAVQDVNLLGTNVPASVLKSGSGILNLPVANTYSGTTVVSNGVLSLTGTIGTNTVTVAGGLLVGNGIITGPVTVQSGGAIEAGTTNTIGTLHLSSTLALSGNTVVKINKNAAGAHDLFSGQTSVTYDGTLTVTNLAGTLTTSDTFTLFSPGASAGNFAGIIGSPGPGLAYSFANGVLSVVGVNTNSPKIQFGVSGNTLTLSWPTNRYWILQSQTNGVSVGLSTNWADVAGSASVTNMNFTINPTNPTVFYRLRLP